VFSTATAASVASSASALAPSGRAAGQDFYATCFGLHQFRLKAIVHLAVQPRPTLAPAIVWLTKTLRMDGRLWLLGLFSRGTCRRTSAE
jgi:hypothetical protein